MTTLRLPEGSHSATALPGWWSPTASSRFITFEEFEDTVPWRGEEGQFKTYTVEGVSSNRTPDVLRATVASPVMIDDSRDRTKARFRVLRRLQKGHDGHGANAANPDSVDIAMAFLDRMQSSAPFFATLDDDGSAVLEFEDRQSGLFADITFRATGVVECYKREPGKDSEFFEGVLESKEVRDFLEHHVGVVF